MTERVFVDANVFIGDGRPPGRDVVRALRNLVNSGKISIISTDITINEVTKHFTNHDVRSITPVFKPSVLNLIKEVADVIVPDLPSTTIFERIWERNRSEMERMLRDLNATILGVDAIAPSSVLEDYARGKGLFSDKGKKDQFPDAFIVKLLEIEAENGDIIVFSKDGDFRQETQSERLHVEVSVENLLNRLNLSIETTDIGHFLKSQMGRILDIARKEIDDFNIYFEENYELEGEVTSVDEVEIEEIDEFETDEEEILVTGIMAVSASISYYGPDMESAIYDSEDKRAYAWKNVEGEVAQVFRIDFTMTVSLDDHGVPEKIESMNFVNNGPLWVSFYDDYK